jgi:ribose 5-phosphate isomerase RpiB
MRIAVSSDMDGPVARLVIAELRRRGHALIVYGALRDGDHDHREWSAGSAARCVVDAQADQAVVRCCTGARRRSDASRASVAAGKVPGMRAAPGTDAYTRMRAAALRADAYTAGGARRSQDADGPAIRLRPTSEPLPKEALDGRSADVAGAEGDGRRDVAHLVGVR